jgi:O-antigen/teichoic acid export membrane protein
MFLSQVTGVLYRQMDRIIIIVALTSVLLAQYEIASKLQLLAALSLTFTVSAVFPAASSLHATEEGRGRLKTMFLEGTKYSCAVVLPVTIALMIWADDLVLTWVGPDFAPSIGYARWFLAWVIPTAATALGHTMIVGMGYVRQAMYLGLASAVINLALSIALVRPFGVMGVIVGTLTGYCLVWYPYMRLFLRTLDVTWSDFWRRTAAPILVVCVPWAAIVLIVHLELHANTLVGAFGAAGVSIVLGWLAIFFFGLRSDERREVLASVRALAG